MRLTNSIFRKTVTILCAMLIWIIPILAYATEVEIEGPTPDITAPILKNLSISSNEATPENDVKLIAEVNDDLSGVQSVIGYYRSPNNNTKSIGFYLNSNTKNYEATVQFEKYDDSGDWKLYSMSLYDNKENSATIYDIHNTNNSNQTFDFSNYTIHVTGVTPKPPKEDIKAPVLKEIKITNTSVVKVNESATIVADVTDDLSGVSTVSVSFLKPSGKTQNVYLYFNQVSQRFEGKVAIDTHEELGKWKLRYVHMYDNEYNSSTIYDSTLYGTNNLEKRDFSSCVFEVIGTIPDLIAPVFKDLSIEVEQISKTEAIVKYTAEITDNLSGISSVYANFSKPSGKSFSINFTKALNNKFVGTVKIDKYDELGTWKLTSFTIYDNKGNSRYVREKNSGTNEGYYELSKYTFTVRGVITIDPATPSSLDISPDDVTIQPGGEFQLKTILKKTDGTSSDVSLTSSGTKYISTNPEAIHVDDNGLLIVSEEAKPGIVNIQAKYGNLEDNIKITIPGAILKDTLTIKPFNLTLAPGNSKQLYVESNSLNGVTEVTSTSSGIKYSSDNQSVSVNENGLVLVAANAAPANATITIMYKELIEKVSVMITGPPTVKSLAMSPTYGSVPAGETIQLRVRATMSDGSSKDVTNNVTGTTYQSSDQSKALVSENGLITIPLSAENGDVIISAKNNGILTKSKISVSSPVLKEIEVTPNNQILYKEDQLSLSVKGTFSDGEIKDIKLGESGTVYISSVPSRAFVDENGNLTIPKTATYGEAIITIKNGLVKSTIVLTIKENPSKVMNQIKVNGEYFTAFREEAIQLNVSGLYADGIEKDITLSEAGTTYTSSVPSRATVDENGLIKVPSSATYGDVVITIKNGSLRKTVLITVKEAPEIQLKEISVETESVSFHPGNEIYLKVSGLYTDETRKDISNASEGSTYFSSVPSRALVDENGKLFIPLNATYGPVTITVKNGELRTTFIINVEKDTSSTITEIKTNEDNITAFRGSQNQLAVIGILGNGDEKDITAFSTGTSYVSSVPSRATVDENGKITIPSNATYGKVTITIKNGSLRAYLVITVTEDINNTTTDLRVTADKQTAHRGDTIQLSVMGTLGNGEEKDQTLSSEGTTYVSSVPSRAVIDENGKINIPNSATYGNVTITIKNGSLRSQIVIKIEEDLTNVITSLKVEGDTQTLLRGNTTQLTVIGMLGSGNEKDVTLSTEGTTYISSVPSRATINENGLVTIPGNATYGNVTITVKNGKNIKYYTITVSK
ncbi:Ig-like domain-containing protein [Fictibacillus norfolkensis]|uniref:BIG2 domain-containing protein n=1 Tax=Fictibacillus norfolkensis TaxID=2762233 RepID=A0ABR8SI72_9BACL|nr:Ig-like domain-containing protein [Fictibacillus norfolkensis]MBD7963135.1 hypothetical protein [Fictibacillus norfolkensis]